MAVQVVVSEVELGDDPVGLIGEGHGEGSRGGMRRREGRLYLANGVGDVESR